MVMGSRKYSNRIIRSRLAALRDRSLKELDRVVLRILQVSHTTMRPHIPHFTENLGSQGTGSIERQLQIIHFKYDDRIPSPLGYRLSRACDAEGGLLSGELNPLGAVGEADRQSEPFIEPG
jgi:hypothetical protein